MKDYRFHVILDCGDREIEIVVPSALFREVLDIIAEWPRVTGLHIGM